MEETRQQNETRNPLATKPIGRLILNYAIPSIVAMLVNALYNIVDQIYIGHSAAGYLGNAATTIAFPLVTVALAISLLFGNGCAAYTSLKLGEGDIKDANAALSGTVTSVILAGTLFTVACAVFFDPLLYALGTTDAIRAYSESYVSIILIGLPFTILGTALSNVIRADGSPVYSMACMLVGAVLNTVLDPLFIFTFDMGVAGAAIATVISQVVALVVAIYYFARKSKHIHVKKDLLRPRWNVMRFTLALGLSSFLTQVSVAGVNLVMNNSLRYYGALSSYGADIPLSAMGILVKVSGIMVAVIVGISIGAQPILGFNYGAKNYARVKKTYLIAAVSATVFSTVMWLVFRLIPDKILVLFGDNTPEFVEFGSIGFRAFMGAALVAGFQIISANYFQATGRPGRAIFLSMTRQVIFLIPLMLILGVVFGLTGVLYSGTVADVTAVVVTACFIIPEARRLGKMADAQGQMPLAA